MMARRTDDVRIRVTESSELKAEAGVGSVPRVRWDVGSTMVSAHDGEGFDGTRWRGERGVEDKRQPTDEGSGG